MDTFIPGYSDSSPDICTEPASKAYAKTLIVKTTSERIAATIRCLLEPEDDAWSEIECIVVELGLPDADGAIIWKNAGSFQISASRFSTANVPGVWERESAEMVLRYAWASSSAETMQLLLRKEVVYFTGKIEKRPLIEFKESYSDNHFHIEVARV